MRAGEGCVRLEEDAEFCIKEFLSSSSGVALNALNC